MNYFEILNTPFNLNVDKVQLKKAFYENSKKFHPDYHTLKSDSDQDQALELSTLNNLAYQTLSDFDKRIKYILQLNGDIQEGENYQLPPEYLMEMMDCNEAIMDLEMDFTEDKLSTILEDLALKESNLKSSIEDIIEGFSDLNQQEFISRLKEYYYKKKYLLRIRENLDKFGAR